MRPSIPLLSANLYLSCVSSHPGGAIDPNATTTTKEPADDDSFN